MGVFCYSMAGYFTHCVPVWQNVVQETPIVVGATSAVICQVFKGAGSRGVGSRKGPIPLSSFFLGGCVLRWGVTPAVAPTAGVAPSARQFLFYRRCFLTSQGLFFCTHEEHK